MQGGYFWGKCLQHAYGPMKFPGTNIDLSGRCHLEGTYSTASQQHCESGVCACNGTGRCLGQVSFPEGSPGFKRSSWNARSTWTRSSSRDWERCQWRGVSSRWPCNFYQKSRRPLARFAQDLKVPIQIWRDFAQEISWVWLCRCPFVRILLMNYDLMFNFPPGQLLKKCPWIIQANYTIWIWLTAFFQIKKNIYGGSLWASHFMYVASIAADQGAWAAESSWESINDLWMLYAIWSWKG